MTQYIQENLPGIDRELAILQRKEIGEEATQMYLARQFIKWGKYAKFSKDPEFIKRCGERRLLIATKLMSGNYR